MLASLFVLAILGIALLTLQSPEGTFRLSDTVRIWLEKIGIEDELHSVRSNAHLVEYFILGIILALLGGEMGWKAISVILIGAGIGLADECFKILLPTREFDFIDWLKDCLGIIAAVSLVWIIQKYKKNKRAGHANA